MPRRHFVRVTGSALVAAAGLTACGDSTGNATGTVRVTISGLGGGISSAGSAVITGEGVGPLTIQLPAAGSGEEVVPVGTYHVVYAPPAGYAIANDGSNEADVTITQGQVSTVTFTVVAIAGTGTLAVTVTGLDASAGDGGSMSVLRTDIGGQTPTVLDIPASGAAETTLVAGTYTIDYTAPDSHQLAAGQTDPRDITITPNQTANVAVQVEYIPPAAGVVFHSDFRTGLGTGDAALLDKNQDVPWDSLSTARTGVLEIISAAGLDFPSTNCRKVTLLHRPSDDGGYAQSTKIQAGSAIPGLPNDGDSLFYRWYYRCVAQEPFPTADHLNHNVENGNANQNWQMETNIEDNGTWRIQWAFETNAFPNNRFRSPFLPKHQTFRVELHIQRVSSTSFDAHTRIYDTSGTLLYTDADFNNASATGTLADVPSGTLKFDLLSRMDELQAGCNGFNPPGISDSNDGQPYVYDGCYAVRTDDWCGPYAGGV